MFHFYYLFVLTFVLFVFRFRFRLRLRLFDLWPSAFFCLWLIGCVQLQRGGSAACRRCPEAVAGRGSDPRLGRPVHGLVFQFRHLE